MRKAYDWRGDDVLAELTTSGEEPRAAFSALMGELQFTPRDRGLGVRPCKWDDREAFLVRFVDGGIIVFRVDDERRVIELLKLVWFP